MEDVSAVFATSNKASFRFYAGADAARVKEHVFANEDGWRFQRFRRGFLSWHDREKENVALWQYRSGKTDKKMQRHKTQ